MIDLLPCTSKEMFEWTSPLFEQIRPYCSAQSARRLPIAPSETLSLQKRTGEFLAPINKLLNMAAI